MLKRTVKVIHQLRIYFLAFFVVAAMYYVGQQPADLSRFLGAGFSKAIGMSTSVPENEINKYAFQLNEKEKDLAVRESELDQRELSLARDQYSLQAKLMVLMLAGIGILFILIALNYYFDYRRRKNSQDNFKK